MSNSHEPLFGSIRAKCQQEHWFGPDCSNPKQYEGILAYDPHFDIRSIESIPADDPNRFGFVFPPANEEQLCLTEAYLGFPLPPLLRALYATIANGGFGPESGLRGVSGGYGRLGSAPYPNEDETIVGSYQFETRKGTVDLTEASGQGAKLATLLDLQLAYGVWPRKLLPICDMGCVQEACVDDQERMFIAAPLEGNEIYWIRQLPWTLEEWLWRWIKNEQLTSRYWAVYERSI
jgi:hypothetical protein